LILWFGFGCGFLVLDVVFWMFWFNFGFGFKNPKPHPKSKFFWIPVSGIEIHACIFFQFSSLQNITPKGHFFWEN
jgi:hypothetical protein